MVSDDIDPLPASVEELTDAGGDAIDLLVEVIDEPAARKALSGLELMGRPRDTGDSPS